MILNLRNFTNFEQLRVMEAKSALKSPSDDLIAGEILKH